MTKSKNTKRALLMSILSMMLCIAMLAGSTFAWFTDSVTSGMNKIVAGNLDIELEYRPITVNTDGTTTLGDWTAVPTDKSLFKSVDETQWEPGHTEYVYLRIRNAGSLALKYQFDVNVSGEGKNGEEKFYTSSVKEGDTYKKFKLSEHLVFNKKDGTDEVKNRADLWLSAEAEEKAKGDLSGLKGSGTLMVGTHEEFTLAVYMPTSVGNEANQLTSAKETEGKPTIYLGLTLIATQASHENDSFGDDYDANAKYNEKEITSNKVTAPVNPDSDTKLNVENGSVSVPKNAVAGDTLTLTIEPTDRPKDFNVKVESNQATKSFDISVEGLKKDNDVEIEVKLLIGKNLKNVTLYHYDKPVGGTEYDSTTGIITFKTKSFSPYTVVFDSFWNGDIDSEGLDQNTNKEEKTVYIDTPEQLAAFAQEVNSGNTYEGYTIKLTSDIDLSNVPWTPIGDYSTGAYFNGNFDGQGHTIKNLNCEAYVAGLFGRSQWKPGGKQLIKNFTVENANVVADDKQDQGGWSAAVVYGDAGPQTDFENITVKGDIIVTTDVEVFYIGAIVGGRNWYGAMNNCHVYANEGSYVECKGANYINYTAGLAAWHGEGTKLVIQNSSSNIDIRGVYGTAGLLGVAQYGNMIENCTVGLNEDGTMRRVNISRSITSGDNQDANDIGGIVGMITDNEAQNICITKCTGMVHFDIDFGNINHDGVIGNNYSGNDSDIIVIKDCNIDWTKKQ